jgi:hypothetical protein
MGTSDVAKATIWEQIDSAPGIAPDCTMVLQATLIASTLCFTGRIPLIIALRKPGG